MKKLLLMALISILIFSTFPLHAVDASGKFGKEPFADVKTAVNNYITANSITNITANKLTAMVLAVTWPETSGGLSYTPSPMTLSRADGGHNKLWSFENTSSSTSSNSYIQAHFNPGVGIWQLDTKGLGKGIAAHQAINVKTAAPIAIHEMYTRWNGTSGTEATKRAYAWKPWYACGSTGSNCETIYNTILTNNTLNITEDNTVTSLGGMEVKSCSLGISTPPYVISFSCYKINPTVAQGHKGSWQSTINGNFTASTPINPLSKTFISFLYGSSEKRYWIKSDTGYANTVSVTRPTTQDSRTHNSWAFSTDLTY